MISAKKPNYAISDAQIVENQGKMTSKGKYIASHLHFFQGVQCCFFDIAPFLNTQIQTR